MSWEKGQGIDGVPIDIIPKRGKEETAEDLHLKLCVKIHNFYEHLDDILVTKTRDAREKEGIRCCINEVRKIFGEELRYVVGRMR